MGKHSKPEGSPLATRPDGSWLDRAEDGAAARDEAFAAVWEAAEDYADDGRITSASRERLVRAARTLAQGVIAAVVLAVAPEIWEAVQHPEAVKWGEVLNAVKIAAGAAFVAYVMPKRK